jgi:DNA-binding response OmpR family regulator
MSIRISIANSNSGSRGLLERLVSGGGFEVRVVTRSELLKDHVRTRTPDVIVVTESIITDCSAHLKSHSKAVT